MSKRITRRVALAAALAVGAAGCDQATNLDQTAADGPATLKVLLTDAAADYLAAARVDIGEVQLLPVDGAPVTVSEDGTDGMVNLLDFQNGATTVLAQADIDPGQYKQLRLIIDGADVTLADGYTFPDGSSTMTLKVPSGAQTGIKLNLRPAETTDGSDADVGVSIIPGETVLVLDFDASQSFVIQGNPETPAGIKGVHFQPTLRVIARDVAGSISGTVSGAADSIGVAGLTVTAEPTSGATVPGYQTTTATAVTDADGGYTIPFLVPGDYEVSVAVPGGFFTAPLSTGVTVGEAANVTDVDFVVDEAASIAGTVSGAADSIAVAGLTVTAQSVADPSVTFTAVTGDAGAYSIGGVTPGEYTLTVAVPTGFATTPASADVTVAAGDHPEGVDFVVDEGGTGG